MNDPTNPATERSQRTRSYHERTKHHHGRFARSPGYLDWASQPDPFRTYAGAPLVELPLAADGVAATYADLFRAPSSEATKPRALELESIAAFFELALGLTAWKQLGTNRWALRADPSSGNLHPTEGYAVLPTTNLGPAGVYHYVSRDHVLERRCAFDAKAERALTGALPTGGFAFGITSIHWREAWKYGERAFRYCQHDAGHVIATARFAAAALGWSARLVDGLGDDALDGLLGIERDGDYASIDDLDREHGDALLVVAPHGSDAGDAAPGRLEQLAQRARECTWSGSANPLSPVHAAWSIIDDVAEATWQPGNEASTSTSPAAPVSPLPPLRPQCSRPAAEVIRARRSAVALDGQTSISNKQLFAMLDALLPRPNVAPWDALPWEPRIHVALFVHRVRDLAPGLYLLERSASAHAQLYESLDPDSSWTAVAGCPAHLRLFQLFEGDCRQIAGSISCGQDIAADGAFSVGMLAEFRAPVDAAPHHYRQLFWEAGVLGQVLYLEAEAAGVRGTGIGCYFDDAVHDVLGLKDDRFQSMYHFTLGGPVDDERLTTLPAYAHLVRGESASETGRPLGAPARTD